MNLDPQLKIFISVDVVGSTAYKNRPGADQSWLPFFRDFYSQFPILLGKSYSSEEIKETLESAGEMDQLTLWKALGDELIFQATLTNYKQALIHILAFRAATEDYLKNIRRGKDSQGDKEGLGLKCAAWLAGFPVCNAFIFSSIAGEVEDYIGPSIDVGFRLSKFATQRKFIVSVDLALMLVHDTSSLEFYFDGEEELKGALNGKRYPIIWIRVNADQETLVDALQNKGHAKIDALKSYCRDYIKGTGWPLITPFIDGDQIFKNRPEQYDEKYDEVIQYYEEHQYEQGENVDQSGDQISDKEKNEFIEYVTSSPE